MPIVTDSVVADKIVCRSTGDSKEINDLLNFPIPSDTIIHKKTFLELVSQSVGTEWVTVGGEEGLSITLTPQNEDSVFMIFARWAGESDDTWNKLFAIFRDAQPLGLPSGRVGLRPYGHMPMLIGYHGDDNASTPEGVSLFSIDAPKVGTEVTYSLKIVSASTQTVWTNRTFRDSDSADYERFNSEIVVLEFTNGLSKFKEV